MQDWGVGFHPDEVPPDHFGLEGIRQRVAILGGSAQIESTPGAGTRICVDLPVIRKTPIGRAESHPEKNAKNDVQDL